MAALRTDATSVTVRSARTVSTPVPGKTFTQFTAHYAANQHFALIVNILLATETLVRLKSKLLLCDLIECVVVTASILMNEQLLHLQSLCS